MTKVFCEECRDDVNYTVVEKKMTGRLKGKEYKYKGKEARCLNCGHLIYVDDINDYNLKALYDTYRKVNDIVLLEVIHSIPEKYAIGKRPLSLLLGWGEQTFTRYYEGDMPTKQYSDILKRIYEDPAYYKEILEKGKDYLKSEMSYKKSRKAVDALLQTTDSKIDIVIDYLLSKCEDITPLALQKALYYIQGFYFAFYHSFLFDENCEAWQHGPVYRDVYLKYRNYRYDPIEKSISFDESLLSDKEKDVINSVINNLCCYSGKTLERFTHKEKPWLDVRKDLEEHEVSNHMILKESIGSYFSYIKEKYNMTEPDDVYRYARDMFEKI